MYLFRFEKTPKQPGFSPAQSAAGTRYRLLDNHGAAAQGAGLRLLGDGPQCAPQAPHPLLALRLQRVQPSSQPREGRELGGAVFFPGCSPWASKTC